MRNIINMYDVIDLDDKEVYINLLEEHINKYLLDYVREEILKIDPYQSGLDFYSVIEEIIDGYLIDYKFYDNDIQIELIENSLNNIYGYHATKLFQGGFTSLKILRKSDYEYICKTMFDGFADEEIQKAIENNTNRINDMNLNFCSNIHCFDHDGSCHYLIYGSETLLGIVTSLNPEICRRFLRNNGVPYILKCRVPIEAVTSYDKIYMYRKAISRYFKIQIDSEIILDDYTCFESFENDKIEIIESIKVEKEIYDFHDRGFFQFDYENMKNIYRYDHRFWR